MLVRLLAVFTVCVALLAGVTACSKDPGTSQSTAGAASPEANPVAVSTTPAQTASSLRVWQVTNPSSAPRYGYMLALAPPKFQPCDGSQAVVLTSQDQLTPLDTTCGSNAGSFIPLMVTIDPAPFADKHVTIDLSKTQQLRATGSAAARSALSNVAASLAKSGTASQTSNLILDTKELAPVLKKF